MAASDPNDEGGFLARWSRRKREPGREPQAVDPLPHGGRAQGEGGIERERETSEASPQPAADPGTVTRPAAAATPAEPPPTMADVEQLDRNSDYSRFAARDIDPAVQRAAMKKLFSDPHFNVMDGLDTYIGDYNTPDPLPLEMLRRMQQSAVLGLFADDPAPAPPPGESAGVREDSAPTPEGSPRGDAALPMAQSPDSLPAASPLASVADLSADDRSDLRLQQDDVAGRPGASQGPGT